MVKNLCLFMATNEKSYEEIKSKFISHSASRSIGRARKHKNTTYKSKKTEVGDLACILIIKKTNLSVSDNPVHLVQGTMVVPRYPMMLDDMFVINEQRIYGNCTNVIKQPYIVNLQVGTYFVSCMIGSG